MPLFFKTLEGIALLSLGPYLYVVGTIFVSLLRLQPRWRGKALLPTLLLSFTLLHGIPLLTYASAYVNDLLLYAGVQGSRVVAAYAFVGAALIAAQASVYLFPFHLLMFLTRRFRTEHWKARMVASWVSLIILFISSAFVSLRMTYDLSSIRVDRKTHAIAELPERLHGFRLCVIADTQLDDATTARRLQAYVNLVNRERPDMILFAGDLVTGTWYLSRIREAAAIMGELSAPFGTYAVIGDHDYWTQSDSVAQALDRVGISTFTDTSITIRHGKSSLGVTFLTNIFEHRAGEERLRNILGAARQTDVRILLTHFAEDPIVHQASAHGYDFVAAGHTHGGQIGLNIFGFRLTSSHFESGFVSGFHEVQNTLVYVCNGLGMSVIPVRYLSTPSIGMITLRKGSGED